MTRRGMLRGISGAVAIALVPAGTLTLTSSPADAAIYAYQSSWPSDATYVPSDPLTTCARGAYGDWGTVTAEGGYVRTARQWDPSAQVLRAWAGIEYWDGKAWRVYQWKGHWDIRAGDYQLGTYRSSRYYNGPAFRLPDASFAVPHGWSWRVKWYFELYVGSWKVGNTTVFFAEGEYYAASAMSSFTPSPSTGSHYGYGYCTIPADR